MKKLLTLLATVAVAVSLAMPVFAQKEGKKPKETASSSEYGQAHKKHAKKKGATEGKKEGQEGTTPGQASKQ